MPDQRPKASTRGDKRARSSDEPVRRRRRSASDGSSKADEHEPLESVQSEGEQTIDDAGSEGAAAVQGAEDRTVGQELKKVVREAAIEVLSPVARKATTAAAKYAVTKGPKLATESVGPKLKDALGPRIEEAGGPGALAKGALSTVTGAGGGLLSKVGIGGGGDDARGTGKGRRLPIQESVDVAVPLETAYNQFTQFEDFPKFMHRVEKVEQRDDAHLVWHENIWGVRREWEVEITDQRPNERIAWKSLSGTETTGVVTFHELSDRLTRIEVNVDFQPHGPFEKIASGFRMSRRALKSDLMRFKAFTEMRDEETGAWRGRIEEGEVVGEGDADERAESREPEERERGESAERDEGEERGESEEGPVATKAPADEEEEELEEEEPEAEEDEETEAEAEPEPEDEDEDETEGEPATRRRRVRRRAPARPTRQRR